MANQDGAVCPICMLGAAIYIKRIHAYHADRATRYKARFLITIGKHLCQISKSMFY
jgi:hypothetical protein